MEFRSKNYGAREFWGRRAPGLSGRSRHRAWLDVQCSEVIEQRRWSPATSWENKRPAAQWGGRPRLRAEEI
ncbi:hypothetical protein E2562_022518 [Oryza meyeriana var. granulata]|uniref:Uncharacterized protein n=1 Tax=Oryza meyeriana var. granulata TaxID=110450 RepID=A0A6G1BN53_9ORYZ|nr:hypothetical protein E2562_022518 [Oryza meyeriana var. granulata]